MSKPAPPVRGRPRDPARDRALLAAALTVLDRDGYEGFTIESVASVAGTSKVTLYRRWPSAAALLLAALAQHGAATVPAATTGDLARDLHRFFTAAFTQLNGRIGVLLRSLMAEAQATDKVRAQFREQFIHARREALRTLLVAARDRGELAAAVDLDLLLDLLFGAMWYRLLVAHAPLDRRLATAFADLVRRYR
jgi:AcrR family transcriptional regulator